MYDLKCSGSYKNKKKTGKINFNEYIEPRMSQIGPFSSLTGCMPPV
jgi:hypothetical protein